MEQEYGLTEKGARYRQGVMATMREYLTVVYQDGEPGIVNDIPALKEVNRRSKALCDGAGIPETPVHDGVTVELEEHPLLRSELVRRVLEICQCSLSEVEQALEDSIKAGLITDDISRMFFIAPSQE